MGVCQNSDFDTLPFHFIKRWQTIFLIVRYLSTQKENKVVSKVIYSDTGTHHLHPLFIFVVIRIRTLMVIPFITTDKPIKSLRSIPIDYPL